MAFERVCLLHLPQIKTALGISGIVSNAYSWRSLPTKQGEKGAQIDLLIDRNDNVIDLCEMKYTKDPYEEDSEEEKKVQHRLSRFLSDTKTNKAVHLVLISANSIKRNAYSDEFQFVITSEALFHE